MKSIIVALLGALSVMYLLNIGFGIFEFIPDNLPFIGNLDEAGAVALLLMCLRYFGFDLTNFFHNKNNHKIEKS